MCDYVSRNEVSDLKFVFVGGLRVERWKLQRAVNRGSFARLLILIGTWDGEVQFQPQFGALGCGRTVKDMRLDL